ncbi:MAG: hypothetical protein LV479_11240 [Methylacidiphilales bacterium]|nr:hypothetical protein [Candidatus Methylacidiphilales bacterium]
MKNQNETLCEYLDRLWNERGEAASRDAINAYKSRTGKRGMLSIQDQISALETAPASVPRPASLVAQPTVAAPVASVSSTAASASQPELHGQDRVRASIRAGFAKARSGTSDNLPRTNFAATKSEAQQTTDAKPEIFGKARLQAGIRSQLEKQKRDGSLPRVALSAV